MASERIFFVRCEPRDMLALHTYVGTINAVEWCGYPARTLQIHDIHSVPHEPDIFTIAIYITHQPDNWDAVWRVYRHPCMPGPTQVQLQYDYAYQIYRSVDFDDLISEIKRLDNPHN